MVKGNPTAALFQNQLKQLLKSPHVLLLFLIFPIIGGVMSAAMAGQQPAPGLNFGSIFGTIHLIFSPLVVTASLIAEEREKGTLRCLILSGVKPTHFLLSIGGFILLCSCLSGCFFLFLTPMDGSRLFWFFIGQLAGSLPSILIGALIGMVARSESSANALAVPIGMAVAFAPMLGLFQKGIHKVASLLYSQAVSELLTGVYPDWPTLLAFVCNILLFVFLFQVLYRKNRLDD